MNPTHIKTFVDCLGIVGSFIVSAITSTIEALPVIVPVASGLVGITWGLIKIWETETVRGWFKRGKGAG